jgi:hypothetical protein
MRTRHAHRVQVLVAGQAVDAPAIRHNPSDFQQELGQARRAFGSALCNCLQPPLKLVIREREGKLFLAAWPTQAERHALDCPFYTEQRTGAAEYVAGAIEVHGERTRLALAHPIRQSDRHAPASPKPLASNANGQRQNLNLWGILHHLWEQSGLNRWYPGWSRDWSFVRHALRRVAQSTEIDGQPLLTSLYVPPVWIDSKKTKIDEHWAQFCASLIEHHRRTDHVASAFVIGKVRSLDPTEFGHGLMLHHHAPRFFMDAGIADNLARFSRSGWAAAKHLEVVVKDGEKPHVIAAMRVEATGKGRLIVVEAALMRVSPRYIPVNSSYEDRLARILVDQVREFVRPLHYDNHSVPLPHFILRDTDLSNVNGGSDVAMHVYGAAISAS